MDTYIQMQDAKDIAELVRSLSAHVDDHAAVLAACQTLAHVVEGEQEEVDAATPAQQLEWKQAAYRFQRAKADQEDDREQTIEL